MTTRTKICSWNNLFPRSASIEEAVSQYLGVFADDYDAEAIVSDYSDAINAAMKSVGTCLVGDDFIGPADHTDDVLVDAIVHEAVESVNLGGLCGRHDISEVFAERVQAHVDNRIALADATELLDFAYLKLYGGQYDAIVHERVPMMFHAGVSSPDELEKKVDGTGADVHDRERFVKTPGGFFELTW